MDYASSTDAIYEKLKEGCLSLHRNEVTLNFRLRFNIHLTRYLLLFLRLVHQSERAVAESSYLRTIFAGILREWTIHQERAKGNALISVNRVLYVSVFTNGSCFSIFFAEHNFYFLLDRTPKRKCCKRKLIGCRN